MKKAYVFVIAVLMAGLSGQVTGQQQAVSLPVSQKNNNSSPGITLPDSVRQWINEELDKAKVKTLTDYQSAHFFRKDTSRLIGYISGYHPRLGFSTGLIYAGNILTGEDYPLVVAIHPDGRFEVNLPMDYPLYTYVTFNNKVSYFYIEPGQSLAMILNWDDFLKAGKDGRSSYRITPLQFFGPAARINSELAATEIKRPPYAELSEKVKTLTPEKFKEQHHALWKANSDTLEQALASRQFTPQARIILRDELALSHANYMFDYAMQRGYKRRQDTTNAVLNSSSDSTFYEFFQGMPLNEPHLLISTDFSTFINRYEFDDAFMAASSLAKQKKTSSSAERELMVWKMRDSVLTHYYQLEPSLTHEISKVRKFNGFSGKRTDAHQYLSGLTEGISNPYLLAEAERLFPDFRTNTEGKN